MTNDEIKAHQKALEAGKTMSLEDQKRALKDLGRANRIVLAFKRSVDPKKWPAVVGSNEAG